MELVCVINSARVVVQRDLTADASVRGGATPKGGDNYCEIGHLDLEVAWKII